MTSPVPLVTEAAVAEPTKISKTYTKMPHPACGIFFAQSARRS